MANIAELDPLFVRALRLLHSKSKESEIQLKSLLDESIRQRKAGVPVNIPTPPLQQQGSNTKSHRGENEKNLDRLKRDLSQMVIPGGVANNKKPRLEVGTTSASSGSGRLSSSMTPSPTASVHIEEPDEMEMDLDFQSLNDCTCFICKSFNQENGNKLMECHTCQNLYHQECHEPVITDNEVADPRLIWNCSTCSTPTQLAIPPASSSTSSQNKSTKPVINKIPSTTSGGSTSRSGTGSSGTTSSNSSSKAAAAMGMTGLAASFSSSSSSSKSSSSKDKKLRRF